MIHCIINDVVAERFANDVGEVVRLFYPMAELQFNSNISEQEDDIVLKCGFSAGFAYAQRNDGGIKGTLFQEKVQAHQNELEKKRYEKWALKCVSFLAMQEKEQRELPWGSLTGVRPSKLARAMIQQHGEHSAKKLFLERFFVSPEKTDLTMEIVKTQNKILQKSNNNQFDLYIGIPFCRTRCLYCSFAAYELGKPLAKPEEVSAYLETLQEEIRENLLIAKEMGYHLRSLYIGGGTPTAISEEQLESLLECCRSNINEDPLEWTVEAGRPDTITAEKLRIMKNFGVNRISINPQTMHEKTLEIIGRAHTQKEFLDAYTFAKSENFDCINMDLIVGLPGENAKMMEETMQKVTALSPENLTVHTLAIKRSAALKQRLGEFMLANDKEAQQMLDIAQQGARTMGLLPYYLYRQKYMSGALENVGYAIPGKESLYNIDIMEETQNILALGSGAISKWIFPKESRLIREANPKDIPTYIAKWKEMTQRRKNLMENALC